MPWMQYYRLRLVQEKDQAGRQAITDDNFKEHITPDTLYARSSQFFTARHLEAYVQTQVTLSMGSILLPEAIISVFGTMIVQRRWIPS